MQSLIDFILRFKEYITLVALVIISMSIISMGDVSQIGGFRTFLVGVFSVFTETFDIIPNPSAVKNENNAMRELNLTLSNEVMQTRHATIENENLKKLLGLKTINQYKYIAANVIGRTTIEMRNYFFIDKGSKAGICTGMSVRTASNLTGIVSGTTSNHSIVETLTNSNIRIYASLTKDGTDGLITWDGGNYFLLKNIPTTTNIKVGDDISTSNVVSRFPAGIPIGRVTAINQEHGNIFSNIRVEPYLDISKAQQVFVIQTIPDPERYRLIRNLDKQLEYRKTSARK